ncbi:unnamed protein product [Diamesa serratosioi]
MKISLHNASTDQTIMLETKTIPIGRGFFGCNDKRISRSHGQITVLIDEIKVKSTHENPIFYKINLPEFKILKKNEEIILGHGHYFSLLPNEHIYEIRVTDENLAGNQNTTTTSSDSQILNNTDQNHNATSNPCSSSSRSITPNLDEDDYVCLVFDSYMNEIIPQSIPSSSRTKRPANQEANEEEIKKMKDNESDAINIKPDPDAPVDLSTTPSSTVLPIIKPDPDAPVDQNITEANTVIPIIKPDPDAPIDQSTATSSTVLPIIKPDPDAAVDLSTIPSSTVLPIIKPDPDGPSTSSSSSPVKSEQGSTNNTTPNQRTVCQFGIKCYRIQGDHRRDFAHPGDIDYRRPDFLPAPDTAPDCEYGASCYRRNPLHFLHQPASKNALHVYTADADFDDYGIFRAAHENVSDSDEEEEEEEVDNDDSDRDVDYQRERTDRTSSDDEENNIEE